MLMAEMWRSLLRRWHWVVMGVLLSAAMCVGVYVQIGPQYTLVTESLLLPPSSSSPQRNNPYLGLSTLNGAVDVVSAGVLGPKTSDAMRALGISATVTGGADPASPAPLIIATVTAKTPTNAKRASNFLLAAIPETLTNLQARSNVPAAERITSTIIVQNNKPTVVRKSQIRAAIAAFIFGAVLALLVVGALDALLARNRGRRQQSDDGSQTVDTVEPNTTSQEYPFEAELGPETRSQQSGEVPGTNLVGASTEEVAEGDWSR
ncbi:MAG: hypothetical protein M3Y49_16530, partial [Actinomycetota bacterium]|nr:hypothetical protein [Actinomycetota bacterium]